ncbi:MAG: DUF3817 domain-containing protein [Myxococcota bacterium]
MNAFDDERIVRGLSFIEGLSWLVLAFVGMPLKYLAGLPVAVRISGMAHGVLFVLLGLAVAERFFRGRWSFGLAAKVVGIALIPFGALVLEGRWRKQGLLADREPARAMPAE